MARPPSVNFKNRTQVVFVIIPFGNHMVGSCTNNAYGDQSKSKIVYMLLVDAGFSASVYCQSKAKHHTAGDNESVPNDIQPFNSEKIFCCISVQILLSGVWGILSIKRHTETKLQILRSAFSLTAFTQKKSTNGGRQLFLRICIEFSFTHRYADMLPAFQAKRLSSSVLYDRVRNDTVFCGGAALNRSLFESVLM